MAAAGVVAPTTTLSNFSKTCSARTPTNPERQNRRYSLVLSVLSTLVYRPMGGFPIGGPSYRKQVIATAGSRNNWQLVPPRGQSRLRGTRQCHRGARGTPR